MASNKDTKVASEEPQVVDFKKLTAEAVSKDKTPEKDEKVRKLFEGNFEGYDLSVGGELALVRFLIEYAFDKKRQINSNSQKLFSEQ